MKKFSIPPPESGEEVTSAVQSFNIGQPQTAFKSIPLKNAGTENPQAEIDSLADKAVFKSTGAFEKMFEPILKTTENIPLEEIEKLFKSEDFVLGLMRKMNSDNLEGLLQKAMFFADLKGRSIEIE